MLKRTVSPERLAANRRAARHSTRPRTAEGKSRSSLNALRGGCRSKTIELLLQVLSEAPPGGVLRMVRQKMTAAQLSRPSVAFTLNLFRTPADAPVAAEPVPSPAYNAKSADQILSRNRSLYLQ